MNIQLNCKVSVPNFPYILPFGTLINFHGPAHFIYARQTSKLWLTVRYIYAAARAHRERKNTLRASYSSRRQLTRISRADFRVTSNKINRKKKYKSLTFNKIKIDR